MAKQYDFDVLLSLANSCRFVFTSLVATEDELRCPPYEEFNRNAGGFMGLFLQATADVDQDITQRLSSRHPNPILFGAVAARCYARLVIEVGIRLAAVIEPYWQEIGGRHYLANPQYDFSPKDLVEIRRRLESKGFPFLREKRPTEAICREFDKLKVGLLQEADCATVQDSGKPVPPAAGWSSVRDLAEKYGVNHENLRSRLARWRRKNGKGWYKVPPSERGPRDPHFLYRDDAVRVVIDAMLAD